MGKVSYHFFTALFNAVLVYVVLVNFTGWSGAYRDIAGFNSAYDWTNSYFGFQSIQMMLSDLNNSFGSQAGSFSFDNFLDTLKKMLGTITFNLPTVAGWILGGAKVSGADIFLFVRNLFIQPILVVIYAFELLGFGLWYIGVVLGVVLKAFAGGFNIPFDNIPDYHPSSLVIPPVLASGFML